MSKNKECLKKDKKGTNENSNVKEVHYSYFEQELKLLAGRVLTIIDASVNDHRQNKAMKDLIKGEFYERFSALQEFYWEDTAGHSVNLDDDDKSSPR